MTNAAFVLNRQEQRLVRLALKAFEDVIANHQTSAHEELLEASSDGDELAKRQQRARLDWLEAHELAARQLRSRLHDADRAARASD